MPIGAPHDNSVCGSVEGDVRVVRVKACRQIRRRIVFGGDNELSFDCIVFGANGFDEGKGDVGLFDDSERVSFEEGIVIIQQRVRLGEVRVQGQGIAARRAQRVVARPHSRRNRQGCRLACSHSL